ncbi:MAG: RHS repeat-associated core domain-containing protein, partial [Bacteroidota bacterium]
MQFTQVDSEPRLLELIQHEEGRVVPKSDGSGYAYHYDIRDHLGNTRVTFSSETETDTYLATMEQELEVDEEQLFGNVYESRQLDQLTNTTPASAQVTNPNESARLNATQGRVIGPTKSLAVKRGDQVTLSVNAFYLGADSEDNVGAENIIPYILGAFSGQSVVDGQTLTQALQSPGALPNATLLANSNGGIPYAYLNFVFFDEDFVYRPLTLHGNDYVPVSDAAMGNHEPLSVQLTMPTSGYLYVYVSNESNWNINVFFDDLQIAHEHSPVVADESYYPFGLSHNQKPERKLNNKYLYNGFELQDELDLNLYDYGARMYDATLGRWNMTDLLADAYVDFSPYTYVLNNPLKFVDPDGRKVLYVNGYWRNDFIGEMIGSTKPGRGYWGRGFVRGASRFFNDGHRGNGMFIDGSTQWGGDESGSERYARGYEYAKKYYDEL